MAGPSGVDVVELIEDACFVLVPQRAPADHPGTDPQLSKKAFPPDAGDEHEALEHVSGPATASDRSFRSGHSGSHGSIRSHNAPETIHG